ncbi:CBS domain-containing protein [Salsipaludibacter albus]|uniref:CBS domain-containing protein n=1 Tax=Salsipaludibacter albus TaxID=2849650 RepID=UPI001EE3E842|nr:CBS domain-containing protein [Salsipaludibacter albus]MBY5161968.1 CBS domain-containing protein [Salsipaludibacter albus]
MDTPTIPRPRVADLVHGTLRVVHPSLPLRRAAELLAADGIGLLVVENAAGDLAGVVSERDLVAAIARGGEPDEERVGDLMTDDVVCVDLDDDLATTIDRMVAAEVRHLVALDDDGAVVGVVSARDVLGAMGEVAS